MTAERQKEGISYMFMGTVNNSIDDKNRMIVPAKLRSELGNRCILTRGLDRCLYIYTTEAWNKQMEKISQLPESDPKVRAFIRHFCANAAECEFDKQGRVNLTTTLKMHAKLIKECVIIGVSDRIEIWSKERWTSFEEEANEDYDDIAENLDDIEL